MQLDSATVKKVAKLARIRLEDDEVEVFAKELSGILDWVEQLQEVDTEGVACMAGVGGYPLRMREDKVTGGNRKDDVLKNAPESAFDCYVVPKVIE